MSDGLWTPVFDTLLVETVGADWPDIIVTKWEENARGDRRYVETRTYRAVPPEGPEAGPE